jgi:hypothetical protein
MKTELVQAFFPQSQDQAVQKGSECIGHDAKAEIDLVNETL